MAAVLDKAKATLAENLTGTHTLVPSDQQFSLSSVPDQSGKVAVITGGSEGIGYGCTHTLLSKNIKHIFILSLSKDVVDNATDSIREELGSDAASRVTWFQCDMADWKAVKVTADKIAAATDRLDILINNAARGIMTYQETEYGVDRHMAVNHIGHVVLTSHLLPLLKKSASNNPDAKIRITNQASNAHQSAPSGTKFASLAELNTDYGPMAQYGRSKLAKILYARYLARHLTASHPNILANATHPGIVETAQSSRDIHEPYPLGGYGMSVGMAPFKKSAFEGAVSMMFAATVTEKSGEYVCPPAVVEAGSELSRDEGLQEALMRLTRDVVREKVGQDAEAKGCPFEDY